MRVLISAFAFSPSRGSEAAVGWNIARRLAGSLDVVVMHGDVRGDRRGEQELSLYKRKHPQPDGMDAVYVAPSPYMAFLEKFHTLPACWMLYYAAYRLWQKKAFETAICLHAKQAFDVCHQLTYIGYREPGYLWRLGIPFIWGPVSGAENIPPAYYRSFKTGEIFRPLSRDLGNLVQASFPGRIRTAARAAAKVFVVSSAEEILFSKWNVPCERMLETGTKPAPSARLRRREAGGLRLVWSGLFAARKAFPVLIQALVRLRHPPASWSLTVLGDGPLKNLWMEEYVRAGLPEKNVFWKGRVSHEQALASMAEGDVLVHTGLREGTPHVVLEALSLGLPVVCHNAGGMGTAVDDTSGIKIPMRDFESSVQHFSSALSRLISEPRLLERLSEGAMKRAEELSWDSIAERLVAAYQEASNR